MQQPPAPIKEYDLPSPPPPQPWEEPQVHIQTTEPVTDQHQEVQAQSLPQLGLAPQQHHEPVQAQPLGQHSHVPDYQYVDDRQDNPGTHISHENCVNTSPYHLDINLNMHQQLPGHAQSPALRRSERSTRGQTSRYDNFVETLYPVCPASQAPQSYYHYQYLQMMSNQMMTNQMTPNHLMTSQMMTNHLPQPMMLWYQ